jgi:hypothetical protein
MAGPLGRSVPGIQAPEDGTGRLCEREKELNGLLDRVEALIADGGDVRMEGDDLVVSPDACLIDRGRRLQSRPIMAVMIALAEIDLDRPMCAGCRGLPGVL